jgi:DNA-binding MurR/RpiR family transcriptional regulator
MAKADNKGSSVASLISDRYGELSQSHRRVADFILSSPHQAALMTLQDFERETGISQATTNRLGRKLGLSGFQELKRLLRADLQEALNPVEELVATLRPQHLTQKAPWTESIEEDLDRIRGLRAVEGEAAFAKSCSLLASARRVFLIGFGSSAFIAQYAAFCLSSLRDGCHAVPDSSGLEGAFRTLLGAGPEDVALQLAFARYTDHGIRVAERLNEAGTPLILVSDSEEAPHARFATHHFVLGRKSSFVLSGSGTGGVAVVEALLRGTAAAIGPEAVRRRSVQLTSQLGDAILTPPRG